MKTITVVSSSPEIGDESCYEYYLVVSSDILAVITKSRELVECIVDGSDPKGNILSCSCEDSFLDAIQFFKNMIGRGESPMDWVIANLY